MAEKLGLGHAFPVGLVKNKDDVRFECGTCEFFKDEICMNTHPKLHRRHVMEEWCCNLYKHPGMKTIVA